VPTPILKPTETGHFYAFWSEGRRSTRKSMGTKDRAVAEARFAQWLLLGGNHAEPEEGGASYTVADLWAVYWEKHAKDVASSATMAFSWKNLAPHFAGLAVSEVSQKAIDSYVLKRTTGRLGKRVKPQTCRKELTTLFSALRFCTLKPNALISASLIEAVVLPDSGEPRDRWLKLDEMQRLLGAAARLRRGPKLSRGERYLWLGLETAARKQAILDLTWDRVDFEAGVIHYDVPGRKKTSKKRAAVPMSKALRPVLERAYAERENDLVMSNKGAVWATVQLIAIEAGFGGVRPALLRSEKPKATGISPHVLRHTAATHMARRGVPLWMIAKILGNTLAMVERVYAKWAPDNAAATVDLISNGTLEAAK
jgi:integrase